MTEPDRRSQLVAAIHAYLAAGWSVIPIRYRDKLPAIKWEQASQQRATREDWKAWWAQHAGCNVAVVYSASEAPAGKQLVCVDTDSEAAEAWVCAQAPLPLTPTVRTAKGYHRYYYAPADLRHVSPQEGMPEIRAGVHYSLLPPSVHPTGALYEWCDCLALGEAPVADLPECGVALMKRPRPQQVTEDVPVSGCTKYGLTALAAEADTVARAADGTRNDALNAAAFSLGQLVAGGELTEALVEQTMRSACTSNGWIPQWGDKGFAATLASGLRAGKASPRSAPLDDKRRQEPWQPQQPAAPAAQMDAADEASLVAHIEQAVNAVPTYSPPPGLFKGAVPIADLAEGVITSVEERRLLPRRIYGMRSGWPTVDRHFGGFKWQGLMLLSAGSGIGKTTIARHIIFETALAMQRENSDARLLVYILEGGREQFLRYYAAYRYGLSLRLTEPGSEEHMTEQLRSTLARAYEEFPALPIDLCDTTRECDRILFDIESRAQNGPIEGVVLDNIQLLEHRGSNEWQAGKRAAMRALDLADTLHFPFLVLSQVNTDGKSWKHRGGPEWSNNATCEFYAERGDAGTRADRVQSNMTTLMNLKARHERRCCPPVKLVGDWETGRLREEMQPVQETAKSVATVDRSAGFTRPDDADEDPFE